MHRKLVFSLILFIWIAGLFVVPLKAEESANSANKTSKDKKISIAEVEPVIYYAFRRYSRFYGDENTIHGGLLKRSNLLGNPGGVRDFLVDHGFYFDAGVTQFMQGKWQIHLIPPHPRGAIAA